MNTLDTAKSILDELGLDYFTDQGKSWNGDTWTAYVVRTPAGQSIRIYSNDVEANLTLSEWNAGLATGEAITLTSTSPRLIELTITMLLDLHA